MAIEKMKEAIFYTRESDNHARCELCRFRCLIADGSRGICGVRENRGGILRSLVYGLLCTAHIDPIEKKPLFHVMPGSKSYSIASVGCNFRCRHCQNHTISQIHSSSRIPGEKRTPAMVVENALNANCSSISYTYTEPTVCFEFVYETAMLAKQAGLLNVFVTNGYISSKALETIAPYLDASNIDLKAFSDGFYQNIAQARLTEVLDSIIEYRKRGVWIELTTLVIPGLNDTEGEFRKIADFIMGNLGSEIPWHINRFHPMHEMTDYPRTPLETLSLAVDIAKTSGLSYVYAGNAPSLSKENTICPKCEEALVERRGYLVVKNRIIEARCPDCGSSIPGIGM